MTWLKRHITNILLWGIALAGIGLIAYPSFSDWWNSMHQSQMLGAYIAATNDMDADTASDVLLRAEEYNRMIARDGPFWELTDGQEQAYNEQLHIDDSGMMGSIEISKIHVQLPLYHGTGDDVLQSGIGHLAGTSLPIGGETSHCVVSGHRGLPSARLFTDLNKLAEGDLFTMTVLNRTMTYEVDQIRVVEPTDFSQLGIEPGHDYCTLLTCTPYGINTHRLLVRGHRIANLQGETFVPTDALQIHAVYIIPFLAVPILFVLLIGTLIYSDREAADRRARRAAIQEYGRPR